MSSASTRLLHLQELEKRYGSHPVLSIPEWSISEGIYWIHGENGAGKTTLFRILAGQLPYSGKIVLDDRYDQKRDPIAFRYRVSMGGAKPVFPDFLTPYDLIRFTAKVRHAPSHQVKYLTERFGMVNYLHQPIGACSSGMVKKLSLLLTFLGNLRLIILDEPMITIDADARSTLYELINAYRKQSVSFLISSHQAIEKKELFITQSFRLLNKTLVVR